jgi:hypothetical protein
MLARTASRPLTRRSTSSAPPYWLGDSAVRLHALASLIVQAEQLLSQAVNDAATRDPALCQQI